MTESNNPPPSGSGDSYDTAPPSAPAPPPNTAMLNPTPPPTATETMPSSGYPGPYVGPEPDKDSKTMGMLAHLLTIFTGFIGPLVIWLMKKDTSPFVDDQGKEAHS